MIRIPSRFAPLLFGFLMALAMSLVMSFTMTAINLGFSKGFIMRWAGAFFIGLGVSFPTSLAVVPVIRKWVGKLTGQ